MSNPTIRQAPAPAPRPPILCANSACDKAIPRGEEYSFIITYATRGPDGRLGSFQCPDADEIAQGNYDAQHFSCSPQCAALVAHACIDEHLTPRHHAHVATLAEADATEVAERAAMEAHRAELAAQTQQADVSPPMIDPHAIVAKAILTQYGLTDVDGKAVPIAGGVVTSTGMPIMGEPGPEIMTLPEAVPMPLTTEPAEEVPVPNATESPATALVADTPTMVVPIITTESTSPEATLEQDSTGDLSQPSDSGTTPNEHAASADGSTDHPTD